MKKFAFALLFSTLASPVFAGDDLAELEAALRSDPAPPAARLSRKSSDSVSVAATGDLNVWRGSGYSRYLYLHFDLPETFTPTSGGTVSMDAYDVDWPVSTEYDRVSFNGVEIGRLRGGNQIWNQNTFDVPASAVKPGRNTIEIYCDVNDGGWVTQIGWATLTISGSEKIVLTASDGTEPGGILVEWTDDGDAPYEVFRGLAEGGPFTRVAVVPTNAWFDSSAEWGVPYWYCVNGATGRKGSARGNVDDYGSNIDDGLAMSDGALPKIESVDVAEVWIAGEGPYWCFLKWNDFDRERYRVSSVSFDLIRSDSGRSVWSNAPKATLDEGDPVEVFDVSRNGAKLVPTGKHGQHRLKVSWDVVDKATGKKVRDDVRHEAVCDNVKVFFDKYGRDHDGIPNWCWYWPKDGAVDGSVFGSGKGMKDDGRFRFVSWDDPGLLGGHTQQTGLKSVDVSVPPGFPPLYRLSGKKCRHYYGVGVNAATKGARITRKSVPGYRGEAVGRDDLFGVRKLAATISHERMHGSIADNTFGDSDMKDWLFIGTDPSRKEGVNFGFGSSVALVAALEDAGYGSGHPQFGRYFDMIEQAMESGRFVTDFDGDGIADTDETGGRYRSWGFSQTNPDTFGFASYYGSYGSYGDNEVMARDAENGWRAYMGDENRDWAWPGFQVFNGTRYWSWSEDCMKRTEANWTSIRRACKADAQSIGRNGGEDWSSKIPGAARAFAAGSKAAEDGEEEEEEAGDSEWHGPLSWLSDDDAVTGAVHAVSFTERDAVRGPDGRVEAFRWSVVLTNETDAAGTVAARFHLADGNGNALAWFSTNVTCAANAATAVEVRFEAADVFLWEPGPLVLHSVVLEDWSGDRMWIVSQQMPCVPTAAAYSAADLANDKGRIVPASVGIAVAPDGVTVTGRVVRVSDDAAEIHAVLTDADGRIVTSAVVDAPGAGTNDFSVAFPGDELYRLSRPLPYAVESLRIVENGETVHEIESAGTVEDGDASRFRPADLALHALAGSGAWSQPQRGADGLCSRIVYGFVVSNATDSIQSCRVRATLFGTNGQHVCPAVLPVQLAAGTNGVSVPFSSVDMLSSDYAGGVYRVGDVFLESDAGEAVEVLHPGENAIAVARGELGGVPFAVAGEPLYREADGTSGPVVTVAVEALRPQTLAATALLVDPDGRYVATARAERSFSVAGEAVLALEFDVEQILSSGNDGPFSISYLTVTSDIDGAEPVRVEDFSARGVAFTTVYVDAAAGDDANDGRTWATAKRTIQAGVDEAEDGARVVVADGVYAPFRSANRPIEIESVNGPDATVVDGGGTNRCATLSLKTVSDGVLETNTVLRGFTLRNGNASGAATTVYKKYGGGSYHGSLRNCVLADNRAESGGGAFYSALADCVVSGNVADRYGGGACRCELVNCVVSGNKAAYGGGVSSESYEKYLVRRCTIVANEASVYGGGVYYASMTGCIVEQNVVGGTVANHSGLSGCDSCCTVPSTGTNPIAGDPRLVDPWNGDARLRVGSPCIADGVQICGADVGEPVEGNAVSLGVQGAGSVATATILVADGGSATIEAVETVRPFLYWDLGGQRIAERIHVIENVAADLRVLAVFGTFDWFVDAEWGDDANDGRSWDTAKRTLQNAVDAAVDGETVYVEAGTYAPVSTDDKRIRVEGVNGAEATFIDGGGASRCATLGTFCNQTNSALVGFTLLNGRTAYSGGTACGGGSYAGTLEHCVISNCVADGYGADGGGAYYGVLDNCLVAFNRARGSSTSSSQTARGGGAFNATLRNCTVARNVAEGKSYAYGGGVYAPGGYSAYNTVVWGNEAKTTSGSSGSYPNVGSYQYLYYCCTDGSASYRYDGTIAADPLFVDADAGDFHLATGSPCVDAGRNGYVRSDVDLEWDDRVQGGAVDMGCYEGAEYAAVPARPTGLKVRRGLLSWDAQPDATGYAVYRSSRKAAASARQIGLSDVPEYEDVSATKDETWYYWVAAFNPKGTGPKSDAVLGSWPDPPVIETQTLPAATELVAYECRLSAVGGQPPLVWSVAEGTLPPGLSLSSDGIVSGVPQVAATNEVRIAATDDYGDVATAAFSVAVAANRNLRPVIDAAFPESAFVLTNGDSVAFSVSATDPEGEPLSYRWELDGVVVAGADEAVFTFDSTGTAGGSHTLLCTVSDGLWTSQVSCEWTFDVTHSWFVASEAATFGDGSSPDRPLASLYDAITRSSDGDVVYVAPGVYGDFHYYDYQGNCPRIRVIAPDGADATFLDGAYLYCEADIWSEAVGNEPSICLEGFTVRGCQLEGVTFRNCLLTGLPDRTRDLSIYGCRLTDCAVTGNESNAGGILSSCDIVRCTIAGNRVQTSGVVLGERCRLRDTILWGNVDAAGNDANYSLWGWSEPDGNGGYVVKYSARFDHCCTAPAVPDWGGSDNVASDPLLVDEANGDLRIRVGSPCIEDGVQTIGATLGEPVEGFVVSVRVEGNGAVRPMTAVVEEGGSATFEALDGDRPFLGWTVPDGSTATAESDGAVLSFSDVSSDLIVVAAFSNFTFHVDAATGSDGNDGLSPDAPMATIQAAIDAAVDGERIFVGPGTYDPISVNDARHLSIESTDGKESTAIDGGGNARCAYFANGTNVLLRGISLSHGRASYGAGAYGGTLVDCDLVANSASYEAGGLYSGRAIRCRFEGNVAGYRGGGAAYATLIDCLVAENAAGSSDYSNAYGGGTYQSGHYGCTVVGNSAESVSGSSFGGGSAYGWAYNTIFFGNRADDCPEADDYYGLQNCLVGEDPLFADPDDDDYRLTAASPAIDAGANGHVMGETDLDGNERISHYTVDIGCYEYQIPLPVRDADADLSAQLAGSRFSLFVGVNEYEYTSWLSGCVNDANNLRYRCLRQGFWQKDESVLLTDGRATKEAVRANLSALARKARPGDTVLYYQSSHGGNHGSSGSAAKEAYLCLFDEIYEDWEFAEDLLQFEEGVKIMVVLDACNSAGMFKKSAAGGAETQRGAFAFAERVRELLAARRAKPGRKGAKSSVSEETIGWMTAADYDQYSWDGEDGGAFTGAMLDGWATGEADSDGDGRLNFFELWRHAKQIAVGYGGSDATDAQCLNEEVAMSVFAGVVGAPRPVSIATAALPDATEGVPYSALLEAQDGEAPYVWSLEATGFAETSRASTFVESGQPQGWNEDDSCHEWILPFEFPFAGTVFDRCYVADNGTISFGRPFSQYWFDESAFRSIPMVAVLWADLYANDMDVFVESADDGVTFRWHSSYWGNAGEVNVSATLRPDGTVELSYGRGNGQGGFIGLSAGDGGPQVVSARSRSGSMDGADDIVFVPQRIPAGLSLSPDGTLSGTADETGEFAFCVTVSDSLGDAATTNVTLSVAENPLLRPGFLSVSPDPGYVNMGAALRQDFAAQVSHPAGGAAAVEWLLDGTSAGTGPAFAYERADDALHVLRCVASAADLPKTAVREWKIGTLTVSGPESIRVSTGQNATLAVDVVSSLPAAVAWFDDATGEEIGAGETLLLRAPAETVAVRAVAKSALGAVTGAVATVTVDPAPAVDRVFRLSGPAFPGNRLVLRAKPYGDLSEATFAWTRDGTVVSTQERLDVAALSEADFGEYALTVSSPFGTATSEPFVLSPARAGVPFGWGADGHGRTTAPEGLTGVAQIASGMNFNLALSTNGTVTAWGYNGHGGCDVPAGLSNVSSVAAGGYDSAGAGFAVKTDGTVEAWGTPMRIEGYWYEDGYWGPDGWVSRGMKWYEYTNGWDTVSMMPADLTDVVKVAVGGFCAVALKADGSVVSWGRTWTSESWEDWYDENGDYWGQVRVVTTNAPYATPTGLSDVVDVAAGSSFLMALKADGTVVVWNDGDTYYGECDVPDGLSDVVAIGAGKAEGWGRACFALNADGTIVKWGEGDFGIGNRTVAGAVALDAGQEHLVALDADGNVRVWAGWDSYGVKRIPTVATNALAVAAGGYHCTAILPDSDGDTVPDAEELAYGRDPFVWEDWRRSTVSGMVATEFGPVEAALLRLFDASGTLRGTVRTDETGAFRFERVLPATYTLKIEAADAVDAWFDGVVAGSGVVPMPVAVPAASDVELDVRLEPGQAVAEAEPAGLGEDAETGETVEVPLPDGTVVYLDMWPVEADADGGIDLGEVAASHAGAAPHQVTVKPPVANAPVPSPVPVAGVEGERVRVPVRVAGPTGSLRIETAPAGAEVFVDYADAPLGVTPLSVGNLLAGSHTILLRKEGYLRPRPVVALVESDAVSEVGIPLQTAADTNEMTVAVSCCLPDQEIYLDYLPTGDVAPATVGGMDPASHAGDGWFSASHVILLKHPMVRPWAPRVVPEPVRDEETGLWCFDAVLEIEGPQLYDDADGDGVRNDVEITDGGSPFETAATQTTAVPVPFDWLGRFGLGDGTASGYEAAAAAPAANGRNSVWECYVVGLDPTNENSVLLTTIRMDGDTPVIDVNPPRPGHTPESWYRVEGKRELSDEWAPKADGHRFFQVHVVIPGE